MKPICPLMETALRGIARLCASKHEWPKIPKKPNFDHPKLVVQSCKLDAAQTLADHADVIDGCLSASLDAIRKLRFPSGMQVDFSRFSAGWFLMVVTVRASGGGL